VVQPTALYAVDVMEEAMEGTADTSRTHPRLTPHREALGVAAGPAAAQGRAGREQVRP
jgi:hypothetical protein